MPATYQQVQEQVNDRPDHSVCPGRKKAAQKLGGYQAKGVSGPKSPLLNYPNFSVRQ
jgi:hypothetical protein